MSQYQGSRFQPPLMNPADNQGNEGTTYHNTQSGARRAHGRGRGIIPTMNTEHRVVGDPRYQDLEEAAPLDSAPTNVERNLTEQITERRQGRSVLRGIGARYKPGVGLEVDPENSQGTGPESARNYAQGSNIIHSPNKRPNNPPSFGAGSNSRTSSGYGPSNGHAEKSGFGFGIRAHFGAVNRRRSSFERRPRRSQGSTGGSRQDVRPSISGPLGPVRRYMGADLERGETLTIVPNIESCAGPRSSGARRISASFPKGGPLSSHPTVASSAITATVAVVTTSALPQQQQNENHPPSTDSSFGSHTKVLKPHIPKSRTMNVFSNLTASISRPSLSALSSNGNGSTPSSVSLSTISLPEPNPLTIHTAQPSAYWTGRFTALHDRFHAEQLQPHSLAILVASHAGQSSLPSTRLYSNYTRSSFLPTSNTTTALSTLAAPSHALDAEHFGNAATREAELLCDEDNRCRRVFLYLEGLCATSEARRSLYAWQQTYARRMGKETLLPRGGTMEKGIVARFFGGGRRSIGGLPGKKTAFGVGGRGGKRMSML